VTTPGEVRAALAVHLRALDFATVWEYEPENLGELPASTFLISRIDPRETATGPRLDVNWIWEQRIYANLSDYQMAQAQLEELAFAVLTCWRDDPTLGHLVEWWRVEDLGAPPVYDEGRRWLRKSLLVSAMIEHVPVPQLR
jgi:hypothetical protein